jgi:membrane protein YqaA with SNARE-associated domain
LAAHQRAWWLYYALMATIGSLIGGYITYSLASKGGKEALERRLSCDRVNRIYKKFEEHGFMTVLVPAMLPPPFPLVPFLLAAGAMQYSRQKFLGALAVGRGVRFAVVAGLGAIYGHRITRLFAQYYKPTLTIMILVIIAGGIYALVQYLRYRKNQAPAAA